MPVVGFVNAGSADASAGYVAAFRKGLGEAGYVDGQNATVEHHWLEGHESVIGYRPEPLISEAIGMWVITEQVLPTAMIRYSEAIGMWVKDACTRRMYGPS